MELPSKKRQTTVNSPKKSEATGKLGLPRRQTGLSWPELATGINQ
jgi:hypothetical protein